MSGKPQNEERLLTCHIEIHGLVQGVGFRPYVYRLANDHGISGWVENRNDGVQVRITGTADQASRFRNEITAQAPDVASIESVTAREVGFERFDSFTIRKSSDVSNEVTEVSPDIAVCGECLEDMNLQSHRLDYPLINCIHCGPRFSIIRSLPYDRQRTTMAPFSMCPVCSEEFNDPRNRRFHAQPVACNICGPAYTLTTPVEQVTTLEEILSLSAEIITGGGVLAVKGTGGFHLVCNAFSSKGIRKLRELKRRDGKPFALMFRNLENARRFVEISSAEEELLTSWRRPIVLLKLHKMITPGIADGLSNLGIMLPYMPFHHLLFSHLKPDALVMTSGNFSDEPIIISNEEALDLLGADVNGVVTYNREIHNRVDDSVAMVTGGSPMVLRRARGYAPAPVRTGFRLEGILGTGAEKTASFCMGKGEKALMSQYAGDLRHLENFDFYREIYDRHSSMFRFKPRMILCDLHPDYLSSRFAVKLAEEYPGTELVRVQHHHAHIAAVMLEHGLKGEVIGFSFDGTGLGTDGHTWGGEVMRAGYHGFERLYHFGYVPLPGGDKASREPWRMALSYLWDSFGEEASDLKLPLNGTVSEKETGMLMEMIRKKINTPLVSSAGRLFDAVAALTGLNYRSTYQAQAPMMLESAIDHTEKGLYSFKVNGSEISFAPMIRELVQDIQGGISTGRISARFHRTLVEIIVEIAIMVRESYGLDRVVLGGGTFQNRFLAEKVTGKLENEKFEVYLPRRVPVNDQGIAAGQVAIGAHLLNS